MKSMKQWLLMGLCALAAISFTACGDDDDDNGSPEPAAPEENYVLITPKDESIAPFKVPIPELNADEISYDKDGNLERIGVHLQGNDVQWEKGYGGFFWVEMSKYKGEWNVFPEFHLNANTNGKFIENESNRQSSDIKIENLKITDTYASCIIKDNGTLGVMKNDDHNYELMSCHFDYEAHVTIKFPKKPENGGAGGGSIVDVKDKLIGTWTREDVSYIFTTTQLTIIEDNTETFKGAYTFADGKVSYVNGEETVTATAKLLCNNGALVLIDENSGLTILFKDGVAPNVKPEDLQGKWYFYHNRNQEGEINTGITLSGNNAEVIITAWSQKHVGTFTYSDGMLHFDMTEFYSGRGEHGYGVGSGNIDPLTLECSYWWTCTKEDFGDYLPKDMLFIADGDEAYGYMVGRNAIWIKQK